METVKTTSSNIRDLKFSYYDEKTDEFIEINHDTIEEAAKKLGCTKDLLDFMWTNFEIIKESVHSDLADIWKKLE